MGADILERLEAIASREDQVFGAMSNGLEIREAAAEIVRLRGEVAMTEQQKADRDLLLTGTSFMRDGKRIDPATVRIETPAPAMPNGVEDIDWPFTYIVPDSRHEYVPKHQAERKIREALRAADNRDAAGVASDEDAYVIERMGKLLAEIAVIVNGPEPDMTRWSYHDLPEKVRALKDTPAAVPAGEAVADHVRTGVFDRNGVEIRAGDRIVILLSGKSTKKEYWNPEYIVVWKAPRFTLEWVGGGKNSDTARWYFGLGTSQGYEALEIMPPAPVQAAPQEGEASRELAAARAEVTTTALAWGRNLVEGGADGGKASAFDDAVERLERAVLAAHPSACELGAVRELPAKWRALADKFDAAGGDISRAEAASMRNDANELEAALQHRGDSRGGEG